jgi:hypothetical protein
VARRFAFNWGLALVKRQLVTREQIRQTCFRQLLTDAETDAFVQAIEVTAAYIGLKGRSPSASSLTCPGRSA